MRLNVGGNETVGKDIEGERVKVNKGEWVKGRKTH